nr:T9SS type A sorting domain-containing protein [Chitinophagales bacterium]
YPNPTNGQSTLDVYSPKNDKLTATVYDVLGQIVMQEQRDILQGYNKLNYDFSKLAKSGYIIDFRTENQKLIRKIIKQ